MQIFRFLARPFGTPAARIAIGLISLLTCIVLLLDAGLGALVSRETQARQLRHRSAEGIAAQLSALAQEVDARALRRAMERMLVQDPDLQSIGMRAADGTLAAATAQHGRLWSGRAGDTSLEMALPVFHGQQRWGQVELSYAPLRWHTPMGWFTDVPALFVLGFIVCGGLAAFLFVRRVFVMLDPSTVVPGRVRSAYDTLSEGVLILDRSERIVLANLAFRALHPDAGGELNGRRLTELPWLDAAMPARARGRPWWEVAGQHNAVAPRIPLDIRQPDGSSRRVMLNCAPIRDNAHHVRGTLLTFDDQSATEQANARLQQANAELELSREQIRRQNEQLQDLANRDALTGCFNRRAFFAEAESMFAAARGAGTAFSVMMIDIDHFKSFNDRFGHAVGDQVLRSVAQQLAGRLVDGARLCRYGGEEFCIAAALPTAAALSLGELLRAGVEEGAGREMNMQVTASFGVATAAPDPSGSFAMLLERADQALYAAKKSGRNRVVADRRGSDPSAPGTPRQQREIEFSAGSSKA